MIQTDELKLRFGALLQRLGVSAPTELVFESLIKRYQEPHRHYHNLQHIAACLGHFDSVRNQLSSPDTVEYALWFHDAIYSTRIFAQNERKSALLAREVGEQLGVAPSVLDGATKMVTTTAKHRDPIDNDNAILLDIDLAILGTPTRVYARYEQAVRKEYHSIPTLIFDALRARVLKAFLARPTLYFSEYFKSRFENAARRNLQFTVLALRQHAQLRNGGPGFDVDDSSIWLTSCGRTVGEMAWSDVDEVQISTLDCGPFRCDNFIILRGSHWLEIPGDAQPMSPEVNIVGELFRHFPTFDSIKFITAMGCARNESVVVWRRGAEGNAG